MKARKTQWDADTHLLGFAVLTGVLSLGVALTTWYGVVVLGATELNPINGASPLQILLRVVLAPALYLVILAVPLGILAKRFVMCFAVAWLAGDFAHDLTEIITRIESVGWALFILVPFVILVVYYQPWRRPESA